jgi:hypothetical protein
MGGLAPPSQTVGFLLRALEGRQRLLETPNLTKEDTTVYFMSVVGRFELKMAPKFEIWVETKRNETKRKCQFEFSVFYVISGSANVTSRRYYKTFLQP